MQSGIIRSCAQSPPPITFPARTVAAPKFARLDKNESKNVSLPESEKYADNSVILPLYYPMPSSDTETVIKEVQLLLSGA
jgi:dTDP-4-amino-4,6-dideoxygalactose transaminase